MRNLPVTSLCDICGKGFYASPGHLKMGQGKYCSLQCRTKAFSGSGNPNWMGGLKIQECQFCGILFNCKPSHIKIGEGKYCSKKCYLEVHQKKECNCLNCGKTFEAHQCHINRGGGLFCSVSCRNENYKKSIKKDINKFGKMKIFGGGKGGKREDLGGIYFRSSWEANWARYLNLLVKVGMIIKWEFEPDTFEFPVKRGSKFYTPDFKLFNPDGTTEYHEVKGYMDQKSKTKLKRMGIYYPKILMSIIDQKRYRFMTKKFRKVIGNWE